MIADELDAHERKPGWSVPSAKVEEAVRAVVKSHSALCTLIQDFDVARRTFHTYEATLIWLAGHGMVPDDLVSVVPSRHSTRFCEPNSAWVQAIENLKRDADAELPQ